MPNYQYYFGDAFTGQTLGELPFTPTDRYTRLLSGCGGFSGTIPLDHPLATKANFRDRMCNLIVVRNNIVRWWGPIVSPVPDLSGRVLQIGAREPVWWMQKRCFEVNKHYNADTHYIFRKMWDYVTSKTDGGSINAALAGITVGTGNSGITRRVPLAGSGRYFMADVVQDFLVDDPVGLEYRVDYGGTVAAPTAVITLGSPLGTTLTHLMSEHTVTDYGLTPDFDQSGTRAHVVGASEAATKQNTASIASGFPLMDVVIDRSNIQDSSTLDNIAKELRRKSQPPIRVPDVEFNPTSGGLTFAFCNLGDKAPFDTKSPSLLSITSASRRVVEIAVQPETDTEPETVGMTFNLPLDELGA